MVDWNSYHRKRHSDFLLERRVKSIRLFGDAEKISLAEKGAACYHPDEDNGWSTRAWLESIHCVHHHGCCTGCHAIEECRLISNC